MTRFRLRISLVAGLLIAALVVSLPMLGLAQDATPEAVEPAQAEQLIERGAAIYASVCIACHQPEGAGIEGIYPALAGNPLVTLEDPTVFVRTVLYGRGGMPRFNTTYSDEEIAGIVSYVRSAWGNDAPPVSPAFVAQTRAEFEARPRATPVSDIAGQDPAEDQPATPEP